MVDIVWFDPSEVTLALGAKTADIAGGVAWTAGHQFRIAAVDLCLMWDTKAGGTGAALDESIVVGLMDAQYSLTELEECLESGVQGPDDGVEREQARRKVVMLGAISARNPILSLVGKDRAKINMTFPNGVNLWAYNPTQTAIVSSTTLNGLCKIFGVFIG